SPSPAPSPGATQSPRTAPPPGTTPSPGMSPSPGTTRSPSLAPSPGATQSSGTAPSPGAGPPAQGAPAGLVAAHRRPAPPYDAGPEASRLGATAMIDVSDGLLADLGHVAAASGVHINLTGSS